MCHVLGKNKAGMRDGSDQLRLAANILNPTKLMPRAAVNQRELPVQFHANSCPLLCRSAAAAPILALSYRGQLTLAPRSKLSSQLWERG